MTQKTHFFEWFIGYSQYKKPLKTIVKRLKFKDFLTCGMDETRTRDLLRDRQAF